MNTSMSSDTTTFGRDLTIDLRDEPVGSMSISPSGRDVVLASQKGLYIIDLDNPYDPPRFLRHHTTWEVADVQWSPHASRPEYVVSTSNQKACVWNLSRPSSRAIEHVLHEHTRAITDINWGAFHPEILATCAVDSFVHCWDLRTPRIPVQQFSAWRAAGTQVKWNRVNAHVLASSHDNILYIWDDRKGAQPVKSIIAHDARIYGIDWNRTRETGIVTCSSDKCVKFWDYGQKEEGPERIIRTEFPLLRARHVPFGWGIMVMPQRCSPDLFLWDRRARGDVTGDPVAKFSGHNNGVREFLWRVRGGGQDDRDTREFQLAIGHDENEPPRFRNTRLGAAYKSFKIEPPDEQVRMMPVVLPKRGRLFKKNTGASVYMTSSRGQVQEVSPLLWMRGVRMGKAEDWEGPENFGEEISWFEMRYPQVKFEKINVAGKTCTIALQGQVESNAVSLRLNIQVPAEYPKALPHFEIEQNDEITKDMRVKLMNMLYKTAAGSIELGRPCIEACVKSLLGEKVEPLIAVESDEDESSSEESAADILPEAKVVVQSFPLPKKCAAIFCGNGKLVCFFPKKETDTSTGHRTRVSLLTQQRQMAGFDVLTESATLSEEETDSDRDLTKAGTLTIHDFPQPRKLPTSIEEISWLRRRPEKTMVSIYDSWMYLQERESLCLEYVISGPPAEVCRHNARVAQKHGLYDLEQVWRLSEMILVNETSHDRVYWGSHPFGHQMVKQMFSYFEKLRNVQMLAMLSSVFLGAIGGTKAGNIDRYTFRFSPECIFEGRGEEEEECVRQSGGFHVSQGSSRYPSPTTPKRSSPWNTYSSSTRYEEGHEVTVNVRMENVDEFEAVGFDDILLPQGNHTKYRQFLLEYGEMLYRWGQYSRRAELLKSEILTKNNRDWLVKKGRRDSFGVTAIFTECRACGGLVKDSRCSECKKRQSGYVRCGVCQLSMRGMAKLCLMCGHGLHVQCGGEDINECVLGCGCKCEMT